MIIPYGEYRPDVSDYQGAATRNILNVVPRGDGYGPFPAFSALTAALPGVCRGGFYALDDDGTVAIFAGTGTRLYKLDNSDFTWDDVSKGGNAYSAVASTAQWRFAQFGTVVIAVQANVAPQAFTLGSSSAFDDLAGSPPQAAYIDVVGRFLVLSGLTSNPYRVHWSGLNAITTWTSGTNSSDFQDFPDGGIVRGVAGGENGLVFQDQAIRRMTYAPGSAVIFQIERISQDRGVYGPYSIVRAGERVFFFSAHGFHMIDPGGLPVGIGREYVDRTFFADLNKSELQLFMGAADPRTSRVWWAYSSASGVSGLYDKLLGYDYSLKRWYPVEMQGQHLMGISQPGVTLESLDDISASLDALTASLDSYASSLIPEISQFGNDNALGFFRGDNLEATLETSEQAMAGSRVRVRGFRPLCDAATVYGSCSGRETLSATPTYSNEIIISERTGNIDLNTSTRYSRLKSRIPAGTNWTFAAGVEPDIVLDGAN